MSGLVGGGTEAGKYGKLETTGGGEYIIAALVGKTLDIHSGM